MLDTMHLTANQSPGALDERWFRELISIQAPLLLHTLAHPESDQVLLKRFLDRQEPPRVSRAHIPTDAIEKAIKQCQALLDRIIQQEDQKSIRALYAAKIEEMLDVQYLLRAVHANDAAAFARHQRVLFGTVDPDIVHTIVRPKMAGGSLHASTGVARALLERATRLIPQTHLPELNQHTYAAPEIAALWNRALKERFKAGTWKAAVSSRHFRITVAARSKTIHIPATAMMSATGLRRLYAHEVNAHIARRDAGRRSPLKLLRIGTAGLHRTEEGLALIAEQIALQATAYRGVDKYVALAVALGALDGTPKNFIETFDVLHQYFRARFNETRPAHADELAIQHAWVHTRAIFRTSDPDRTDMHFIRGKVYLEGNRGMWQYLRNHTDAEFLRLFTGRFSPADFPHLDALGII